jgi:hypothetical protein
VDDRSVGFVEERFGKSYQPDKLRKGKLSIPAPKRKVVGVMFVFRPTKQAWSQYGN